jgi:hypothetical protein
LTFRVDDLGTGRDLHRSLLTHRNDTIAANNNNRVRDDRAATSVDEIGAHDRDD